MCRRRMSVLCVALTVLFLLGCQEKASVTVDVEAPGERPNILLVVVDDMGFADLGSFGGEIPTPNLDNLAYAGVRLTNFITGPACSPSRAMLLTGVDAHISGFGNLKEELAPSQRGKPGHEGYLNDRVVTIASLMRDAGYRTYLTGKWHLGIEEHASPVVRGFQESFAMLTNASHFSDMRPAYSPDPDAKAAYRNETGMLSELPSNFEYSSQFFVDQMIEYLEQDEKSDAPFFAYLAFSAPHWPLQAPDEAIERFRGKYDKGYDVILERRVAEQRRLGLISDNARASQRAPKGVPWSELSDEQKKTEARSMEVYAAMVAEIDRHTGRIVDYLREQGLFDNTVIIFMSDNGAEGHDYDDTWPKEAFPAIRKVLDENHDFSYQNMGRPGSYTFYGPNWARVSAPTMRLYKAFPTEGGVHTSAFVYSPDRFASGTTVDDLIVVKDFAPTILELAKVPHPGDSYAGRNIEPMTGVSAVSVLEGVTRSDDASARIHADELIGKRGIRQGDWKLVHMPPPYGNGNWQLYDLAADPAESDDLADDMPGKVAELVALWDQYAEDNGVVLPDWVSGY